MFGTTLQPFQYDDSMNLLLNLYIFIKLTSCHSIVAGLEGGGWLTRVNNLVQFCKKRRVLETAL